jgi:hypothetical protein
MGRHRLFVPPVSPFAFLGSVAPGPRTAVPTVQACTVLPSWGGTPVHERRAAFIHLGGHFAVVMPRSAAPHSSHLQPHMAGHPTEPQFPLRLASREGRAPVHRAPSASSFRREARDAGRSALAAKSAASSGRAREP